MILFWQNLTPQILPELCSAPAAYPEVVLLGGTLACVNCDLDIFDLVSEKYNENLNHNFWTIKFLHFNNTMFWLGHIFLGRNGEYVCRFHSIQA